LELRPGASFGPYRILDLLGSGGMASVYRAHEESLDRDVALKVVRASLVHDAAFAERFRREALLVARLEHPHIVPIHAFGIEEGTPWMAMRLITGGTLASLLRERRPSIEETVRLIGDIAQALDYAHGKGIIHRDVKPQNMLLDDTGRIYLSDFGIARMLEAPTQLTATGTIQGTPAYMAPEQATGQSLDPRCDIYALGVVAYEALTGRVPFTGPTPMSVLLKHVSDPMPLPAASEVAGPLVAALHKALAKRPRERWPTAAAFAAALQEAMGAGGTAPARPVPTPVPLPRPALLPWIAGLGLALGAVLAAAIGLGVYVMTRPESPVPRRPTPVPPTTTVLSSPASPAPPSVAPLASPPSTPRRVPSSAPPSSSPAIVESLASGPIRVYCEAALHPEFFAKAKAEDVADSTRDLQKAIGHRRTLELAESRDRADIVVQVLERGRAPAVVGRCQMRVRLLFGAETFEILGQDSFAGMNTWGGAAGGAADRVETWAKTNYDRVLRRRKGPS
jgi:serine/threonine-protein kinase